VFCFAQTTEPNQTEDAGGPNGESGVVGGPFDFDANTGGVLVALLIIIVVFAAGIMGSHLG
jgi:hypothetical protein